MNADGASLEERVALIFGAAVASLTLVVFVAEGVLATVECGHCRQLLSVIAENIVILGNIAVREWLLLRSALSVKALSGQA